MTVTDFLVKQKGNDKNQKKKKSPEKEREEQNTQQAESGFIIINPQREKMIKIKSRQKEEAE